MSPFWESGFPLFISLRSPAGFFPLSPSLVAQCSGLHCLIRRFEVFAILSHFKACGDGARREDEAVPVAGAMVKSCAWRNL